MGDTIFNAKAELIDSAIAEEQYKNPLLTWIRLIFTDAKANINSQGIPKTEFDNVIKSMVNMPIKANYTEDGLQGHSGAIGIGVITSGEVENDERIIATGALWNDEYSEIVEFFKNEFLNGRSVDFSWEVRYKDSEISDGVEWLKGVTTKAVTAVKNPAYGGRTHMLSISELLTEVNKELIKRGLKPSEGK